MIDDDPGVVQALREDLSRRFGGDFRVAGTSSPSAGLAVLGDMADAHEPVALLIVDHDMSEMPGIEFLGRAHEMHPLAKRVLLVGRDYSARSPVVQAMTLGYADCHMTKPWLLEQDLYRSIVPRSPWRHRCMRCTPDAFVGLSLPSRDTAWSGVAMSHSWRPWRPS